MNYGTIKKYDVANGTGVRVSLFVSGCRHHCKGCFNTVAWDFHYGQPFTEKTANEILDALAPDYIQGFSLLGGEPFEPENQRVLVKLLRLIHCTYPSKDVWCYSGYLYDVDMIPGGKIYTEVTEEMLSYIDVLVDGEFIEEEKDLSLAFRGSRNQRILHLKELS
ncbi:MAG: anaerobic ribonucleoside-triphosphate reductase activating protein [Muricoprocola sp.]